MKKLIALLLITVVSISLVACSSDDTDKNDDSNDNDVVETDDKEDEKEEETASGSVTVTHELGETEVEINPEKIVVFDLGVLDIFAEVGIEIGGLPTTSNLPEYLSSYADEDKYFNAGGMKEADFEAINEYEPDLIIISGRLTDSYEELAEIAPTIYLTTPGVTYMDSLKENLDILGQIFPSYTDEFNDYYDTLSGRAAEIQSAAEESGLTALIIMVNDGSVSVFGEGTRYGIVHDDLGFTVAGSDIEDSTHGQEAGFEYIAEVNPDILFVIDRSSAIGTDGVEDTSTVLDNDLVNGTNAALNENIVYLSSDIWYLVSGGFTSTSQMLEEVAAVLD